MTLSNLLRTFGALALGATLLCASSQAAPQLQQGSVVNAASFAVAGTPNAAIARGSIFSVFGVGVGPQVPVHASSFPLPLELGGTSIKVTAGGQTYDAVILFTSASQISAVLPSAVPAGAATLTVTYNGTSNAVSFEVANNLVGIFTRAQTGNGLAVVHNYNGEGNQPVNGINQSAKPGQLAILWGTGLGAALNGDDRNAPQTGNAINLDALKVYVGGKAAQVDYAGRSGCCSGVDQINFVVPQEVEGCFVPVTVVTNGKTSNFTTIAVDKDGGLCDAPFGLTEEQTQLLFTKEKIKVGTVNLVRTRTQISVPVVGSITQIADVGNASFHEYATEAYLNSAGTFGGAFLSSGSCALWHFRFENESSVETPDVTTSFALRGLDVGAAVQINGPNGTKLLPKATGEPGSYYALLSGMMGDSYLAAGNYTASAPGGADLNAFTFSHPVSNFLEWTNKGQISSVNRNQNLTVNWTTSPGSGFADGVTVVSGQSYSIPKKVASLFYCFSAPNAGSLTVPSYILQSMVKSEGISSPVALPGGSLMVGGFQNIKTFTAPGLDVGAFTASSYEVKTLNFD